MHDEVHPLIWVVLYILVASLHYQAYVDATNACFHIGKYLINSNCVGKVNVYRLFSVILLIITYIRLLRSLKRNEKKWRYSAKTAFIFQISQSIDMFLEKIFYFCSE